MAGWLWRLIGAVTGRLPARPDAAVPSSRGAAAAAASAAAADSVAAAPKKPGPAPSPAPDMRVRPVTQFGLRRPLVGRAGQVAGFELSMPTGISRRMLDQEGAAAAAYQVALLSSAASLLGKGRAILVRMSAAMLARVAVAEAVPAGALLCVDGLAGVAPALADALRRRGVRLGVGDAPPSSQPGADFVVLQAAEGGGTDTLLLSAQRWREQRPRVQIIALGLRQLEDLEWVLRHDVDLASAPLGQTAPLPQRELGAATRRICDLLDHLAQDHDTAEIGRAVVADVALTYRLLRYVNSPAIGLKRAVDSVDQALMMLGRAELHRWLTMQLLTTEVSRHASRALQEAALARARLLESLARERGDADPGAFFTLGLLSMIEPLLQVPLAAALAPLRLSEPVVAALLHRRGPWSDRLALLDALDRGDDETAEMLAAGLDVAEVLGALVEQAWQWAAAVSHSDGAAAG